MGGLGGFYLYAPCPGDLAHLPGNQPHHTVFTPSFLDIKKDERYTRTSSRIGKSYYATGK